MQVIKPTPSQAAVVLKKFLKEQGVEMKLSKAQEAVARMQGFADWQSLAGAMDPRVGVPEGNLRLIHGEVQNQYEFTTPNQTYAHILVKNLHVEIKHEDEGVVVDIYPREVPGDEPLDSIGSTYAHFSEAEVDEEDAEGEQRVTEITGDMSLCDQLLAGNFVDLSNSNGITAMMDRNVAVIKAIAAEAADPKPWPWERRYQDTDVVFTYTGWSNVKRAVFAGEVVRAEAYGRDGWILPDGRELYVHVNKND